MTVLVLGVYKLLLLEDVFIDTTFFGSVCGLVDKIKLSLVEIELYSSVAIFGHYILA